MGYRQRAFDLAARLESQAREHGAHTGAGALLAEAAKFLRSEIVIGPDAAYVLLIVLTGDQPMGGKDIAAAVAEVGDIDDLVPF